MVFYYGTKKESAIESLAAVVESADTRDLKSLGSNTVPVQVRSAAPSISRSGAVR